MVREILNARMTRAKEQQRKRVYREEMRHVMKGKGLLVGLDLVLLVACDVPRVCDVLNLLWLESVWYHT